MVSYSLHVAKLGRYRLGKGAIVQNVPWVQLLSAQECPWMQGGCQEILAVPAGTLPGVSAGCSRHTAQGSSFRHAHRSHLIQAFANPEGGRKE